ncbi:helix-turn-helix domain-containing protein [Kocuria marina]|uniref:helix-turn-helix domain-containing protein n=1 Tax=Kocuria marina TaxID=223184 RepID=UPI00298A01DA|nr:helix-turn-helix domain-containing protein [Kocuria marina]MCT1736184.1 helix-turn-helix domain-containing protein [Kocuria marina]
MTHHIPRGARLHGLNEAAAVLGITPQGFIKAGPPAPDVWINDTRGWTTETLHEWERTRPRRRRPLTDELRARIQEMHQQGHSIAETAAACQVSKSTVARVRAAARE